MDRGEQRSAACLLTRTPVRIFRLGVESRAIFRQRNNRPDRKRDRLLHTPIQIICRADQGQMSQSLRKITQMRQAGT